MNGLTLVFVLGTMYMMSTNCQGETGEENKYTKKDDFFCRWPVGVYGKMIALNLKDAKQVCDSEPTCKMFWAWKEVEFGFWSCPDGSVPTSRWVVLGDALYIKEEEEQDMDTTLESENFRANKIEDGDDNCLNGGTWDPEKENCECAKGYMGSHCETTMIGRNQCLNGGTWDPEKEWCECAKGYAGSHCEITMFGRNQCLNGGTWDPEKENCECAKGYAGSHCQIDMIDRNQCLNGGTWVPKKENCECAKGYVGSHCEIAIVGHNQ